MKQVITAYTFSASAKTIQLTGFNSSAPVDPQRLYLITDVTTNTILYNFADSTVSQVTSITSYNTINLSTVGSASSSDLLQIVYEAKSTDPIYETPLLPANAAQETGGNLATIAGAVSSSKMNVAQATAANLNATVVGTGTFAVQSSPAADSTPATQTISAADTASTSTTQLDNQVAWTGTPTANSAASFTIASLEGIQLQITGNHSANNTLVSEFSIDGGTTWFSRGIHIDGSTYFTSTYTDNVTGGLNAAGMTNFRVRCTTYVSGTVTVRITASTNVTSVYIPNPVNLRDSTTQSITNTIKAASTAPAASDTAIVVGESPNSALTTNTNPLVVSGGGAYVRQDSTATIAKESGGNLATLAGAVSSSKMNVAGQATAATAPPTAFETGAIANTGTLPTAVSGGQLVGAMSDKFGRNVVISQAPRDMIGWQEYTFSANTSSETVVSAIASTYTDISSITLTNSGGTPTLFTLSDGTNSYYYYIPAGDMRGAVYQVPLAATATNTNWTGQCTSSTLSLYCVIQYIKNK